MTQLIYGPRGNGKTSTLIKMSAENQIYILVATETRARALAELADRMGYSHMPFPVTTHEYLRSGNHFRGSSIRRNGLYIDDVDDVVRQLFDGIPLKAVSFTTPFVCDVSAEDLRELDDAVAKIKAFNEKMGKMWDKTYEP